MMKCDIVLYKEICKHSVSMEHNSLYYALLDWKDQHQEVRKEVEKRYDSYTVKHCNAAGETVKVFSADTYENPFYAAYHNYNTICDEHGSVTELWKDPNPTSASEERRGKLLYSKEME